jgi:hypothetical protein
MSQTPIRTVAVAIAILVAPSLLNAQGSAKLLADARGQLAGHNLDSAITILRTVTSDQRADSSSRAEAFMWLGVAAFYKGQDSAALVDFREALRNDPLLVAATPLASLDSTLADWWEREQTLALCGEALPAWGWPPAPLPAPTTVTPMNVDARVGQAPEIISGPRLEYPDNLRRALVQGRVLARVIIDTSGHAERGSVRVLTTPHHDFKQPVIEYTEHARFRGAVLHGARVRSCVVLPVDFRISR